MREWARQRRGYPIGEEREMSSLNLDGLLDTDEHRRLQDDRAKAALDYQHAGREVKRLHLIVRLLGTQASEGIQ